jgi:rod shape-determining protein MreB
VPFLADRPFGLGHLGISFGICPRQRSCRTRQDLVPNSVDSLIWGSKVSALDAAPRGQQLSGFGREYTPATMGDPQNANSNAQVSMFNNLLGFFSNDIGIDLGTANTLVYVKDHGIVLREPSVVAVQQGTNKVLAVGDEAKRMLGRTPGNIVAIRPLKDGVIADFEVTEAMLRHFISKVHNRRRMVRPRVVIAVPSGITEVEKRAVKDSATHAGAREVYLIEEPMAAAIGCGLPVQDAAGNMIIDVGGGTTEVALISLSGIVFSRSVRVAGDELDEAVINYMKRAYNLMIGERTAEDIKIKIGSAYKMEKELSMEVKGRDLVAGLPKTISISSQEVREAVVEPVSTIVDSVRITLERCPPELSADLVDRGLVLAGGGALLRGLDKLLQEETGLTVHVAEDPLSAVAEGTGRALQELRFLRAVASRDRSSNTH